MEVVTKDHLDEEETVERRSFLDALTGASLSVLSKGAFTEFAKSQNTPQPAQIQPIKLFSRRRKSKFQKTRYSCAAMERDLPFCWCMASHAQA